MKLNHGKEINPLRKAGTILKNFRLIALWLLVLIFIAGSTLAVVSPAMAHEEEGDCFNEETGEATAIECAEADNAWQEFLAGVELLTDFNQDRKSVV